MTQPLYVPVLNGKEGEFGALAELELETRRKTRPVIEIPEIPFDWDSERSSKSLSDHLVGLPERLASAWNVAESTFPIFLDFPPLHEDSPHWSEDAPLEAVLIGCTELGVKVLPVLYRATRRSYLELVAAHAAKSGEGACLRLFVRDFDDSVDLEAELLILLATLALEPEKIDLIIDLEEIHGDLQSATLIVRSLRSLIPHRGRWRTIVLVGASFPQDLSDVGAETIAEIPRLEWVLWKRLGLRPNRSLREDMIFGDYGISHPVPREMDPRMMRMSASIRYTTPDNWLVVKGRNVRQWGFDQYYGLCETIVRHSAFSGDAFSWADGFIALCAQRRAGPGNATTWRKVGINHHITRVATQLANPDGS